MRWARYRPGTTLLVFFTLLLIGACGQQASGPVVVTLRIKSTSPDEEVSFKGTYLVDTTGVQEIEAQTPFDVEGQSDTAFARLEKVAGEAQLLAELVRLGPDGHRDVASASGPRIEVRMTTPRTGSGP